MTGRTLCLFLGIAGASFAPKILAQDETLDDKLFPIAADEGSGKLLGWEQFLRLGMNGSINENKNVVGNDDGQARTFGFKLDGDLNFGDSNERWLNSLNILVSYAKTTLIDEYVKSEDTIEFDSIYKIYLDDIEWAGLYAQLNLDSSLFPSEDLRPEEVTYIINKVDEDPQTIAAKRLHLTDQLRPFKISESIGTVASVYAATALSWDIKLGLSYRQVIANDQLIINDNSDTDEIEVDELQNFDKAGYEVGTELKGSFQSKKITYAVKANVLFPFYESLEENGGTIFARRVIDLSAKASIHLVEWLSLDYAMTVNRDPDISQKAQVSQSLLFSVNQTLVGGDG